ncbi:MAG: nitrilase family protein [Saprospiraceae bacterium]|nr:nitrilase family protein [Saprospiraceae bacterium]
MRFTIFQMDIVWEDVSANLHKVEQACTSLKGRTDILICPEMFNTGYILDPISNQHLIQIDIISALQKISERTGITIAGSIPVLKDANFYNDFIIVDGNGLQFSYSKIHLFTPAGEAKYYKHGMKTNDYTFNGIKIRPLVCYDLRFPYCSFNTTGYAVLVYSANWPKSRISHWRNLMIARAIENQCYVIGVNRVGEDKNGFEYPGNSMIVNFNGEIIIELGDQETLSHFEPQMIALNKYREQLPFLKDIRDIHL